MKEILWSVFGGSFSVWLMMHIWLPDPPPGIFGRFLGILVAGMIGGFVGGLAASFASLESNPMPGYAAAAATGLLFSGIAAFLTGAGRRNTGL